MHFRKPGLFLNELSYRFSVPSLYDLRIENSSMDDAGLYQCIGNNGFGGIVVEYNVTILGEMFYTK